MFVSYRVVAAVVHHRVIVSVNLSSDTADMHAYAFRFISSLSLHVLGKEIMQKKNSSTTLNSWSLN